MSKVIQDIIPIGRKNRPAYANPCNFITIHNTGNTSKGANAKSHASYIKGESATNLPASWHYTVDDKEIYQHLPDTETAYHAGDGSGKGNRQSIGIEICMNSDGDLMKATKNAVELVASLMVKHSIPIENVVQHHNWSGKNCPQMLRDGKPYSWATFLNDVLTTVTKPQEIVISQQPPEWAKIACDKAVAKGFVKGDGQGNYDWNNPISLARMLVLLDNMRLL